MYVKINKPNVPFQPINGLEMVKITEFNHSRNHKLSTRMYVSSYSPKRYICAIFDNEDCLTFFVVLLCPVLVVLLVGISFRIFA